MDDISLLIGNDINNIEQGNSWSALLNDLKNYLAIDVEFPDDKPFPLAYEEIFFKTIKLTNFREKDIKQFVAEHVGKIRGGKIHQQICQLGAKHILTTNYDLSLEYSAHPGLKQVRNVGVIPEQKYSIFRKHQVQDINFWHIHGSASVHQSITLGYEHYSGYLQYMRNYIVTGTKDTYKKKAFKPLLKRIKDNQVQNESWLDLFFTKDVHIFALSLDFVETDLWWLLTYREKIKCEGKYPIDNTIYYYIPDNFLATTKSKVELLESLGVQVIAIHGYQASKQLYYENVIARIGS